MAVEPEAIDLVREQLAAGKTEAELREFLQKSGYSNEEIIEVFLHARTHPPEPATEPAPVLTPAEEQKPVTTTLPVVPTPEKPLLAPKKGGKKKRRIVVSVVMILIAIAGAYFLFLATPAVKDCGTSTAEGDDAYECIIKAIEECQPAEVRFEITDPFDVTKKTYMEVKSGTPENCTLYSRVDNFIIGQDTPDYYKATVKFGFVPELNGTSITCKDIDVNEVHLRAGFLIPTGSEEMYEKCNGSYPKGPYIGDPVNGGQQISLSISDCNQTHVKIRNMGGIDATEDADIFNSSGSPAGSINFSVTNVAALGATTWVGLYNTSGQPYTGANLIPHGVYDMFDDDYPDYFFTC